MLLYLFINVITITYIPKGDLVVEFFMAATSFLSSKKVFEPRVVNMQ